jgi:hypothetical protein
MKKKLSIFLICWTLFSLSDARSQTNPGTGHHKKAVAPQNFKVCRSETGYYICSKPQSTIEEAFIPLADTSVERTDSYTGLMPHAAGERKPVSDICVVRRQKEVCRINPAGKKVSCYRTKHAYNFSVCKNEYGYYVCCQVPDWYNSTYIFNK